MPFGPPSALLILGDRPNSPVTTRSTFFVRPRSCRSSTSAVMTLSYIGSRSRMSTKLSWLTACVSQL
jgi:hypothetical protein